MTETLAALAELFDDRLDRARRGEPSAVHRARVAARRLRETLALVGGVQAHEARQVGRGVRRVRRLLGRVRELDVTMALFDHEAERHAWSRGAAEVVRSHLQAERERRRHDVVRRLTRDDPADLVRRLRRLASAVRPTSRRDEAALLSARVLQRSREFAGAVRGVGPLYRPEAMHGVRIAGKKLRYSLELVQGLGHQTVSRDLATLRLWQARLGRLNDLHALQAALAGIAAGSSSDATRRAVEAMNRSVEAECRGLHAVFLRSAGRLLLLADRAGAAGTSLRRIEARRMAKMPMTRAAAASRPRLARGA